MNPILVLLLTVLSFSDAVLEPKFAPYFDIVDATKDAKVPQLLEVVQKTGVKTYTLAFAVGGTAGCEPTWGGEFPINEPKIINQIKELKSMGGDVIVATGGALGPYLEASCTSAASLATAYKKILDTVGTTHLDIDIEASINVDNLNSALAQVQKERPSTTVSFTLMVQGDDYGVTDALGVEVLKNAVKHGVNVDIVNPMTMEFGTKLSSWGDAVIAAAESTITQMKQIWPSKSSADLYKMLGVTPMLGRNFNGKIFEPSHAKQLVQWAKSKGIGHLAFWSVSRDNGKCAGGGISPTCSSISQSDYEFTKIFAEFGGSGGTQTTGTTKTTATTTKSTGTAGTGTTPHGTTRTTTHGNTTPPSATTKRIAQTCSSGATYIPHETDCHKYYWCYDNSAHLETCSDGTIFDTTKLICNWIADVNRPECKT